MMSYFFEPDQYDAQNIVWDIPYDDREWIRAASMTCCGCGACSGMKLYSSTSYGGLDFSNWTII